MLETWILLVWLNGMFHPVPDVKFETEAACEQERVALARKLPVNTLCLKREEK